jgi:hypothetical protein
MSAWFESMHLAERIFIFIAAPATIIMLVQTVMLFLGAGDGPGDTDLDSDTSAIGDADSDTGFDVDFDDVGDGRLDNTGLQVLTTRGVIAFLTVAGWTGALCMEYNLPVPIAGILAIGFGFGAMAGVAALVRALMSLQTSGNINYRCALGSLAEVYLTIPSGGGAGKVSLTLGGALTECDAITESGVPIRTGSVVRVTDVVRGNVLVVEAFDEEAKRN